MNFQTLYWQGDRAGHCVILDQTRLPAVCVEKDIHDLESMCQAIRCLEVRGAPALGVAGGYGMLLALKGSSDDPLEVLHAAKKTLDGSRPTAVNLMWATAAVLTAARQAHQSGADVGEAVYTCARRLDADDRKRCEAIGRHGAVLIGEGSRCLTHCNAGALATAGRGTALSLFYEAHGQGRRFKVFATETRPLNQGSRLTSWELSRARVDVTLITDSMAGFLMARQGVDLVVTGADRITANGDAVNKIGTYSLAVLAQAHSIPFYIAAPLSTFDLSLTSGDQVPIEERDPQEIIASFGIANAPEGVPVWNPAFDVTPAPLITGWISERGLLMREDFKGDFGGVEGWA